MDERSELFDRRILAFIDSDGASEPFDALAGDLFDYQLARNAAYRAYCGQLGRGVGRVASWRDIPAPWPAAWRLADLRCFDPADTVATFRSSGTTSGRDAGRSRHHFDTLELYRAALAGPFAEAMLPREDKGPILVLMPSPAEAPDSSLSFMMGEAVRRFGAPDTSGFFVHEGQMLVEPLVEQVSRARAGPIVAASTAFGWAMLLEALSGRRLPLPPGSRLMETGGHKGRTVELSRSRLCSALCETFALPPEAIVSEYGMCELSSQFYAPSNPKSSFSGPPWVRVLAIDPETQQPVPPGEPGLLRVIDLANRPSCIAVQTEDLVVVRGERSFELIGRAPAAPPKGCSLTAEDMLTPSDGRAP